MGVTQVGQWVDGLVVLSVVVMVLMLAALSVDAMADTLAAQWVGGSAVL